MVTIKHTRESIAELEQEREQYKRERDELIRDIATYRDALHVFARLVKYKLDIKASDRYIQYQNLLDSVGINTDELERDTHEE